jgi:hypothetical protein
MFLSPLKHRGQGGITLQSGRAAGNDNPAVPERPVIVILHFLQ